MRILTVLYDLEARGTQRAACNFTLAYRNLGHEVAVLAYHAGGSRKEMLVRQGIPVWIGGDRLNQAIQSAKIFRPDVIHMHRGGHLTHDLPALQLLHALKSPTNRVMETSVFGRVAPPVIDPFIDVHLQISRWCLYRWRRWLGRKADQVPGVLVPNPVDTDSCNRSPDVDIADFRKNHLNISDGAFVCGRIGKTHPRVFQAFDALAQSDPDAYLVSVSDHKEAEAGIASLSEPTRQRVRVLPRLNSDDELARFYSALDCFVSSTHTGESFGYVLAEAMLCGTPVVTSSQPHKDNAQMEVVRHMEGGIVAGSIHCLPEALLAMRRDAAGRDRMRQHCRRLITSRFDTRDVANTALRVAELALRANDRQSLLTSLRQAEDLVTTISQKEIHNLLYNTLGGPRLSELLMMKMVHQPLIYKMYQKYRLSRM